jgi:hypothetical protein
MSMETGEEPRVAWLNISESLWPREGSRGRPIPDRIDCSAV